MQQNAEKADNGSYEDIDPNETLFNELYEKYLRSVITAEELEKITIMPRPKLMGEWFREGDLGFIYGERGNGKTWLTEAVAVSLSTGKALAQWEVPHAVQVLYLDGEMPQEDSRARIVGMGKGNKNLFILHHERLFDITGCQMNLAEPLCQRVVTRLCIELGTKVVVLDNQSCLVSGVAENDADAWQVMLNWLLEMRRRKIAVLMVVHAGKSGQARGTSRREDAAAWVIRVSLIGGTDEGIEGAKFHSEFTKNRNSQLVEFGRNWHFFTDRTTKEVKVSYDKISFEDKVYQCIKDGEPINCSEISRLLGSAGSNISRAAKRLIKRGLIVKKGPNYALPKERYSTPPEED